MMERCLFCRVPGDHGFSEVQICAVGVELVDFMGPVCVECRGAVLHRMSEDWHRYVAERKLGRRDAIPPRVRESVRPQRPVVYMVDGLRTQEVDLTLRDRISINLRAAGKVARSLLDKFDRHDKANIPRPSIRRD